MRKKVLARLMVISILFITSVSIIPIGTSCKNIVVTPPATAGDYSLLLKVRDPSRPGLQVLCRVPKETTYTYHHPWTGKAWEFTTKTTFFGVATKGDTFPNIVKAGMVLTDAGLAFGDSDTNSNWINPTQYAWDDFDWIRYACQTAQNEQEAIELLTIDAVDRLHATAVSENLFVVGPDRAVVIEADAVRYSISDITGVLVMSNYPVDLWTTQTVKLLPLASSFDARTERWGRTGTILRLRSIGGVKIDAIDENSVIVKAVPSCIFRRYGLDKEVRVELGKRATVGPYSVVFQEINHSQVKMSLCMAVYAWEQELLLHIQPKTGTITERDMAYFSRLHSSDLDGLRPMCEDEFIYEASMIFKIPKQHSQILSSGWFSANHACSSIYVPFHICNNDIYDPYQTGEAAALCLDLLQQYGHGTLTPLCENIEEVFLNENEANERVAREMINNSLNVSFFLTAMDRGMQEQAFLTQLLWKNSSNLSIELFENLWMVNYSTSLEQMQRIVEVLSGTKDAADAICIIEQISLSIYQSKVDAAATIGRNCTIAHHDYQDAMQCFRNQEYAQGFFFLQRAYHALNILIENPLVI